MRERGRKGGREEERNKRWVRRKGLTTGWEGEEEKEI